MPEAKHMSNLVHHDVTRAFEPLLHPNLLVSIVPKVTTKRKNATLLFQIGQPKNEIPLVARVQVPVGYCKDTVDVFGSVLDDRFNYFRCVVLRAVVVFSVRNLLSGKKVLWYLVF